MGPAPRFIARNTYISLAGYALPSVAALFAIPGILHGLGPERFGLLVLAWAVIGYLGIFDLGLGQSLTRNVARALADNDHPKVGGLAGSGLLLLSLLGVVAEVVAFLAVPLIVSTVVEGDGGLADDASRAFSFLAVVLPAAVISPALSGILEARGRFDLSNAVSMPLGAYNFVGPLLALQFSSSLATTVAVLAVGRVAGLLALLGLVATHGIPIARWRASGSEAKELVVFGGWITVSRIVVPLVGHLDRFAIAGLLPLKALSYYGPPVEIASRLSIVPIAMSKVLLPAMSSSGSANAKAELVDMFWTGTKVSLLVMFPASLVGCVFSRPLLTAWLGDEAAQAGQIVLQLYLIYVFVNSLGYPAATLLLSVGKPQISALIQLAGLPIYAITIWLVIPVYGIGGAAAVAAIRVAVDAACHYYFVDRVVGGLGSQARRIVSCSVAACLVLLAAVVWEAVSVPVLVFGALAGPFCAWTFVLSSNDKKWLRAQLLAVRTWGRK